MHWYTDVLRKYAVFEGRAGRPEFWWFALFNAIVAIVIAVVGAAVGARYLVDFYFLAVLLPGLGVSIRRLHDTNRSGWWILIGLVPFGGFVLLVFYILEGTRGPNRFGADPRDPEAVHAETGANPAGFCANCGQPLEPGAAFCRNCGAATGEGS
jgi:uncharacterized membrane protein YhaH (DUF805 family)